MGRINVRKRTLGVSKDGNVLVWAPKAKAVSIHLLGNNTVQHLQQEKFGYWRGAINVQTGDTYRFVVDDKEMPDPASLHQPEDVHGPSAVADIEAYKWTDANWVNPALEDYIFYELHTGTFTPEGTLAAIEERLEHLVDLGITAIEIMPVAEFPGSRNWGYDGVFPFAVQSSYGGYAALQQLVDKCHEKGLAVVLDVVYNHMGPEGNYLNAYGPYFTDKYKTPWGQALNVDDAHCDEVRRYFIENALMWLRDFHIDGLRLDAVHAIKDLGAKHFLQELKENVDELIAFTGRTYYVIAESDLNDPKFITPIYNHGYGMDAQWTDEFHHALRVAAGNEKKGYYTDFEGLSHLAKAYKDAYVYDGIYSPYRQKTFGATAEDAEGKQFVVFSQNHDQVGNRMLGERTSHLVSFEMQKLLAGAVIVSPYLPLLFMGEEWASPQPFQYFISHTDEELVSAVREGRKTEFASFHNGEDVPDPQAEETFIGSKIEWQLINEKPHSTLLKYYKALIALRKSHPVLSTLDRKNVQALADEQRQILTLRRWKGEHEMVCYMNFSKEEQPIQLNTSKQLMKIFDSAAEEWRVETSHTQKTHHTSPVIQPESLLIYATENIRS